MAKTAIAMPKLPAFDFQQLRDDFRTLDTQDPGSWPLAPKIVILLGAFVFFLAMAWFLGWSDQLSSLEQAQNKEQELRTSWKAKKAQAVNLEAHKTQLDEINQTFGALLKQLPNASEVETLLVDINQAGLGHGLQFDLFQPQAELRKEFYAELPIKIRISGTYHELGAFAGDVARLSRIVTLNDIEITVAKDSSLVMNTVAKTFRYLDEEEISQQRNEEKKKADKAKGKGGKK